MKACPNNPTHSTFVTTGVEYHDWLVDAAGNFLDDLGGFEARLGEGEYTCSTCNSAAVEKTDDGQLAGTGKPLGSEHAR